VAVPTAARELVRNTGPYMLSVLATRLETIVSKYNTIMKMIGDYERPLFERKLARIDQVRANHHLDKQTTHSSSHKLFALNDWELSHL